MDANKASKLAIALVGKQFLNFQIECFINNGKSAAVFKATDLSNGSNVAIKIFDNEMIERYGHQIQEQRIQQEISLKGHNIENLIKIIDGGKQEIDRELYYFVAMEFIDGENIKQFISNNKPYDNTFLLKVVKVLSDVTEELLKLNVVHRDIKPENIMIDVSGKITLMDLGVLKLVGKDSFSDEEGKQFVGTLQYAPPEFLFREEENTVSGSRAINLYQIGGVLHDLIMKKELFGKIFPYTNVVYAIKETAPQVSNLQLPFETIQLTRDLLIKNWKERLKKCSIERINNFYLNKSDSNKTNSGLIDDIFKLSLEHKVKVQEIDSIRRSNEEKAKQRIEISEKTFVFLNKIMEEVYRTGLFIKVEKSEYFVFDSDKRHHNPDIKANQIVRNIIYKCQGKLENGIPRPLFLLFRVINDEDSNVEISLLALFLSSFIKCNLKEPITIFHGILEEQYPQIRSIYSTSFNRISSGNTHNMNINFFEAFSGIICFDDQFKDVILSQLLQLIKTALSAVSNEVSEELERNRRFAAKEVISQSYSAPKTLQFYKIN